MNSFPQQQPDESAYVLDFHHDGKGNIYTVSFEMKLPVRPTEVYDGIVMLSIPAGSFFMGSNWEDDAANPNMGKGWYGNEKPVHEVEIGEFWMSQSPITQRQYNKIAGNNPSKFTGDDNHPVEQVSWFDAVLFCNKLSKAYSLDNCYDETTWECDFSRNGFRLPTEAEWEYACRAGTTSRFYLGDDERDLDMAGWFVKNSGEKTHPMNQKEPNYWNLRDMHGNVYEWCYDWYSDYTSIRFVNPVGSLEEYHFNGGTISERVLRGGAWHESADFCRSAHRASAEPHITGPHISFRIARTGAFFEIMEN